MAANRLLRDWTNSDKVDTLTVHAEVFFVRLIMKADDYGCFWADPKRLKANLFPLKSDLRDTDISRWIAEGEKAGLIVVYKSDDKKYLQIVDFGQRLRNKSSKYPLPNDSDLRTIDSDLRTIDSDPPPEVEEELEEEVELEGKGKAHARERILGVFNAEEEILKNQIRFEPLVMNSEFSLSAGREILHKYHLYLEENNKYPMSKKQVFAGFEKWLINEKNFTQNGQTHQRTIPGGNSKPNAGEEKIRAYANWPRKSS